MHVSYWRENEPTKMAETNLQANALSFVATWKFFVWDRNNTNTIFFYLCLVWYFLFVSVFRSLLNEPFTSENLISDSISRADRFINPLNIWKKALNQCQTVLATTVECERSS